MPPRTPGRPERFMDRYRERLNEEMKEQGETDRSLAKKVEQAGYPLSFTALNKTRAGTRQPSMDEVYAVLSVLGFDSLDRFLHGSYAQEVQRAGRMVGHLINQDTDTLRADVHLALTQLARVMTHPDVVAASDQMDPAWRTDLRTQVEHDVRWAMEEQAAFWRFVQGRVAEIFDATEEEER